MPGFFPHFLAGNALFLMGKYYMHVKDTNVTVKKQLGLYTICIISSIIPDTFLGVYYTLHIGNPALIGTMHTFLHYIISPTSLFIFLILDVISPLKYKFFWIIGIICILVHVIMDVFIQETGIWI